MSKEKLLFSALQFCILMSSVDILMCFRVIDDVDISKTPLFCIPNP